MKFYLKLFKANLKQAVTLNKAFLLQMLFMFFNNIVFFCNWLILYSNVKTINGWKIADCDLIYAISTFSFGVYQICFGGVKDLSKLIANGELDTYILQPKDTLLQSITSKTIASGWGDVLSSLVLLIFSGYHSINNLVLFIFFIINSSVITVCSAVIYHSLAFWLGPVNTLARNLMEYLIILSSSPGAVHAGVLKGIIYTVIPAGFLTLLPAEVIKQFNPNTFLIIISFTICFALFAVNLFRIGMRKYESSSGFVVR